MIYILIISASTFLLPIKSSDSNKNFDLPSCHAIVRASGLLAHLINFWSLSEHLYSTGVRRPYICLSVRQLCVVRRRRRFIDTTYAEILSPEDRTCFLEMSWSYHAVQSYDSWMGQIRHICPVHTIKGSF